SQRRSETSALTPEMTQIQQIRAFLSEQEHEVPVRSKLPWNHPPDDGNEFHRYTALGAAGDMLPPSRARDLIDRELNWMNSDGKVDPERAALGMRLVQRIFQELATGKPSK